MMLMTSDNTKGIADMRSCLFVALGGAIGSVARYLIGLIEINEFTDFPVKTVAINILGSFLIGLIVALSMKKGNLNPDMVLFAKVGICGGFTTFSTFALESSNLLQNGRTVTALAYIFLSIVLSIAAVFMAQRIV